VLFGLFLEIGEVQATILQTLHGHNLQTGHDCGLYAYSEYQLSHRILTTHRWVRSMGADGDQANVAMTLSA
jgi:hypothetical protein